MIEFLIEHKLHDIFQDGRPSECIKTQDVKGKVLARNDETELLLIAFTELTVTLKLRIRVLGENNSVNSIRFPTTSTRLIHNSTKLELKRMQS